MKITKNFNLLVVKDIFGKFWKTYIVIGIFAAFIPLLQASGLVLFIHAFRGDNHFVLPYDLHRFLPQIPESELFILAIASIFMMVSLGLMFISRKLTANTMVQYERICANQVIDKFLADKKLLESKTDSQILVMLSKDCRQGGRMALELGNIVMPIGVLLVVLPIMFYISAKTTFALIALLALTTIFYSKLSKKAYKISLDLERGSIKDSQTKKELLGKLRAGEIKKETTFDLPHEDFASSYRERVIIPHWGLLLGGVQLIFSLILIALLIVPDSNLDVDQLPLVILYGSLAIFTLTQLRVVSKVFASFHVFLAYFQRAFVVIKGLNPKDYNIELFDSTSAGLDELEL